MTAPFWGEVGLIIAGLQSFNKKNPKLKKQKNPKKTPKNNPSIELLG